MSDGYSYTFPAVSGVQAGKPYFVAQVPLNLLVKLFVFDDDDMPAELRAQRVLNERRAKGVSDYVVGNPDEYILPALTASVSEEMTFSPFAETGQGKSLGMLDIPLDATILINDGQHRRSGIELALKERPQLKKETIAVTIY